MLHSFKYNLLCSDSFQLASFEISIYFKLIEDKKGFPLILTAISDGVLAETFALWISRPLNGNTRSSAQNRDRDGCDFSKL